MPKKSKSKQSKQKTIPVSPPAPEPEKAPLSVDQEVLEGHDLLASFNGDSQPDSGPIYEAPTEPDFEDFDPEPFIIEEDFRPELEPEPTPSASRGLPLPSRSHKEQQSPVRYDYRSPPKPAPISRIAAHKRPHSLPTSRLSPPTEIESIPQGTYGSYPHVVACISCDNCALLTNKPVYDRVKLGLHPTNTDTFIPVVCSDCEDDRAKYWLQLSHDISPTPRRNQYPGTISTKMLRSWFAFRDMKRRFDISFDEREAPYKRVTRARDWWREGALTDSETVRLHFWQPNVRSNAMGEEMIEVERRRDLFFGQFVHPKEKY